jgi:hypothetical protein
VEAVQPLTAQVAVVEAEFVGAGLHLLQQQLLVPLAGKLPLVQLLLAVVGEVTVAELYLTQVSWVVLAVAVALLVKVLGMEA